jgi:hypothetical protein
MTPTRLSPVDVLIYVPLFVCSCYLLLRVLIGRCYLGLYGPTSVPGTLVSTESTAHRSAMAVLGRVVDLRWRKRVWAWYWRSKTGSRVLDTRSLKVGSDV